MVACTLDYDWPAYVVASFITLFSGLIVTLLVRYVRRWSGMRFNPRCSKGLLKVQEAADTILSGDSLVSKFFIFGLWIVDVTTIIVYLIEASLSDPLRKDTCGSVLDDPLQRVWISLMCLSATGFFIEFCAAQDKVRFWIQLDSIVEQFTVVPTLVSIYYNRNWLGMRFLRLQRLMRASDVLQLLKIVKSRTTIHLTWAASVVATVWTCGACVFYMLETNGDAWKNYPIADPQNVEYFWDYFYFVLVMMTTIGFGDISPVTTLGKLFLVFYVLICLAAFGKLLPEVAEIFNNRSRFRKPYRPKTYRRHVVLCGGLTFQTLKSIVKSFVRLDWTEINIGMVVIDRTKPSTKLQAFFRRHFNNVTFIEGTVLDVSTLELAKVSSASAVLIVANRCTTNEDEEDAANIMRATAIKNFREDTRIIIQLLQYRNKERLLNIPSWSWHGGADSDEVICISELKMSIMAQNCLAPGIVTLLANLIKPYHFKRKHAAGSWLDGLYYLYGFEHVIYIETMSDNFVGMTFIEAAEICYRRLGIVLIAVDSPEEDGWAKLWVNPSDAYRMQTSQVGFFIAKSYSDVRRVTHFSVEHLHGTATNSEESLNTVTDSSNVNITKMWTSRRLSTGAQLHYFARQLSSSDVSQSTDDSDLNNNDERRINAEQNCMIDPTGMYFWCFPTSLDAVLLDSDSVREKNLSNHVIVLLGSPSATATRAAGLRNFLSPLRASSIIVEDIKTVVFCVNRSFIEPEWPTIASFPNVFVFARTDSLYSDLRALNIVKCSMCVVMKTNELTSVDDKLVDTGTIHTAMSIYNLLNIDSRVSATGSTRTRRPAGLLPQVSWSIQEAQCQMSLGDQVHVLVDLEYDDSVAYIEYDDDGDYSSQPIFLTPPYVCGRVLLASVLDSLVTMACTNSNLMRLFRALITGGELTDLERTLRDGLGVFRRHAVIDTGARNRSIFTTLALDQPPLDQIQHDDEYGRLVMGCLQSSGIICLGLYRLLGYTNQRRQKRYVITNPPFSFRLLPSDTVYALKPFEFHGSSSGDFNQQVTSIDEEQTTDHQPVNQSTPAC